MTTNFDFVGEEDSFKNLGIGGNGAANEGGCVAGVRPLSGLRIEFVVGMGDY